MFCAKLRAPSPSLSATPSTACASFKQTQRGLIDALDISADVFGSCDLLLHCGGDLHDQVTDALRRTGVALNCEAAIAVFAERLG